MFIKNLKNKTINLSSYNLKTVIDIKNKIFDLTGYPIVYQRLYNGIKILDDNKDINYYNLSNMSTIEMSLTLHGGGKGSNNNRGRFENNNTKRELIFATAGETAYAIVKTICGNKRVIVIRIDNGAIVSGRISGSIHAWIKKDDVVLVGLRDFQEDKVDVIWRYTPEECRKLIRAGFIPQNSCVDKNNETDFSNKIEFNDNSNYTINRDEDIDDKQEVFYRRYDMPISSDSSDYDEDQQQEDIKKEDENQVENKKKITDDINIDTI